MRQRFGIALALVGNPRLIIVDEPTAGLDPEERVRFLNLLSELGENATIILSTHIVDDVKELCQRMAIINKGRILLEAEPLRAMAELEGRIWRKSIAKSELADHQARFDVISKRLQLGRLMVKVNAPGLPGEGFEPIAPDLEDVYFTAMNRDNAASGAPAEAGSAA
jgi:ABC-type multidrug transport system ATPase subunit